jgi:hypothetical protein
MIMTDSQMLNRTDINPDDLEKITPEWKKLTVDTLLIKHLENKNLHVYFKYDNAIAEHPCVRIMGSNIYIHVCDKKHLQDYKIHVAIVLIKSCNNYYDYLPDLFASDEVFSLYRSRLIYEAEALGAQNLLRLLK